MKKILLNTLLFFITITTTTTALNAQVLGFFTAKEGIAPAINIAKQSMDSPKLVAIITSNVDVNVGFGSQVGILNFYGDDVGKANYWVYLFAEDNDRSKHIEVTAAKVIPAGGTILAMATTLLDIPYINYDVTIDMDAMKNSDEFMKSTHYYYYGASITLGERQIFGLVATNTDWTTLHWFCQEGNTDMSEYGYCTAPYITLDSTICGMYPNEIEEVTSFELAIYPNPTSDFIYINSEAEVDNVSIYNVNGDLVKDFGKLNNTMLNIDVSNIPTGDYFICTTIHNLKMYRAVAICR
ncbi:MAG: T9SS type A sorting domain-containing protein [Ignavibacteria bacterium]|jgi:hypothetical protein|nr:T9SS type A sorting domain-containing protein [Ignavibacteria bacterium]